MSVVKVWLFYVAIILPFIAGLVIRFTGVADWTWYQGHEQLYYTLAGLRDNPLFQELLASWTPGFFILTVYVHWFTQVEHEDIGGEFVLLPLAYAPFAVIGHFLQIRGFEASALYAYPIIVIICGYLYIFPWVVFAWILGKLSR